MPEQIALGKALLSQIDRELRSLHDLMGELDKAEACGINVDEARSHRDMLVRDLTAIKQNFYPGGK